MVKKNNKKCILCGKTYTYCSRCEEFDHLPRWMEIYCSDNCRTIFNTLTEYNAENITAKGIQEKEGYTLSKCPGCPYCKKTFFESAIGDILDKWHINYETQKRFSDCKDKNPLPFDYYIEDFNIAIEYDGEFHYKPVMLGKTLTYKTAYENMINTQKRDNIKDTYCQDHKINLIRIPFWDQIYMEDILFDKLVEYGALIEE